MSQDRRTHLGYTVSLHPHKSMTFSHRIRTGHNGGGCEEATVVEKRLLEEYGTISRWNGSLGVCFFSMGSGVMRSSLMLSCRKNACGSPTPRPSTISSKVPIVYTRNRTSSGNSCNGLGLGSRSVEGELPLISHVIYLLIPTLGDAHKRQRRAMTPAFGLVEAKACIPTSPVFQFRQSSSYPRVIVDVQLSVVR
jgi:hypothetical protein